jgi:hypothetical protein
MQSFNISKTANVDFYIKRGDTFYFNFQVQDDNGIGVDLSAYLSAKMQVKENEYSSSVLNFSSTGGTIDISHLNAGQVILSSPTSTITANQYFYDLELSNNNFKETVMSGKIFFENDFSI